MGRRSNTPNENDLPLVESCEYDFLLPQREVMRLMELREGGWGG